jgi:hypothetical protein
MALLVGLLLAAAVLSPMVLLVTPAEEGSTRRPHARHSNFEAFSTACTARGRCAALMPEQRQRTSAATTASGTASSPHSRTYNHRAAHQDSPVCSEVMVWTLCRSSSLLCLPSPPPLLFQRSRALCAHTQHVMAGGVTTTARLRGLAGLWPCCCCPEAS